MMFPADCAAVEERRFSAASPAHKPQPPAEPKVKIPTLSQRARQGWGNRRSEV